MKKAILLLFILYFTIPQITFGQSDENKEKTAEEKVDEIKEKVTSKVAELDLVEKRGIVGVVESVTNTQIRLNDLNDKIRIIETDELTNYSSSETPSFDFTSIKEGSKLSTIGLYNKDSKKLLARFINEISIPVFLVGVVSAKDEDEFTIDLSTEDEKNYTVDIENITRTFIFSDGDLDSSGFTQVEILKNAIVIGFPDKKNNERISATRVIIFPNVPGNPNIKVDTIKPTEEASTPTPTP